MLFKRRGADDTCPASGAAERPVKPFSARSASGWKLFRVDGVKLEDLRYRLSPPCLRRMIRFDFACRSR